eukprot:7648571-Heterocapsa_arctica.AAC.1
MEGISPFTENSRTLHFTKGANMNGTSNTKVYCSETLDIRNHGRWDKHSYHMHQIILKLGFPKAQKEMNWSMANAKFLKQDVQQGRLAPQAVEEQMSEKSVEHM